MSVDQAPLREWLARTTQVLERRLTRHALTVDSVGHDGISLGERVVEIARRFQLYSRADHKQDAKLYLILDTCQDPASRGAVWLRALLPAVDGSLNPTKQIQWLADCLETKLGQIPKEDGLPWALVALTAAKRLNDTVKNPSRDHCEADMRLLAAAWQAMPENMIYKGYPTFLDRRVSRENSAWEVFQAEAMGTIRHLPRNETTPPALLPMQLWMAPIYSEIPLSDQPIAQKHYGMLPDRMYGHRGFVQALEAHTPWPQDPRLGPLANWFESRNPYLFPHIQAAELDRLAPAAPSHRTRARL